MEDKYVSSAKFIIFFPLFVLLDNHLCGTTTVHIILLTDFQNQILNSSTVYIAGMLCKDEQY